MARGLQNVLLLLCIATASSLHQQAEPKVMDVELLLSSSHQQSTCMNYCNGKDCWCYQWGCDEWQTDEWDMKGCCAVVNGKDWAPACACSGGVGTNLKGCTLPENNFTGKIDGFDGITRLGLTAAGHAKNTDEVDCEEHPAMCKKPFDCNTYGSEGLKVLDKRRIGRSQVEWGSAARGNAQSWCAVPEFGGYIRKCLVDGDPEKAAVIRQKKTTNGLLGEHAADTDAAYCFMRGHCQSAIDENTTLKTADQMCEHEFGTDVASLSFIEYTDRATNPSRVVLTPPFEAQAELACAMGNFHCDAVYCKRFYCNVEEYATKFAKYAPPQSKPAHPASTLRVDPLDTW